MTILFAPSESKNMGGDAKFELSDLCYDRIDRERFVSLYEEVLNEDTALDKIFSTKKDLQLHKNEYFKQDAMPAINRYTGVAYDYLGYDTLPMSTKTFLQKHLLIFSNLYGVVKPQDKIPYYKLKQGVSLHKVSMHSHYKKQLQFLNEQDTQWLNLSANYYEKFFTPKSNYYDVKFLKQSKVVSHWAKAYRGVLLKECALHGINSIEKLLNHSLKQIKLINVEDSAKKSTLVYEVL